MPYDFSPEARERSRIQGIAFRAQQKERMELDPQYAERIRAARAIQRKNQLEKNPDYYKDERLRRLERDPELDKRHNAKAREKLKSDPRAQELRAITVRKYNLKKKYGITLEDFDHLVDEQDGHCAVCPRELERGGYKTHVDHCHDTGKVRGILCLQCNTALGKMNEDEDIILSMLAYVRKHKEVPHE